MFRGKAEGRTGLGGWCRGGGVEVDKGGTSMGKEGEKG